MTTVSETLGLDYDFEYDGWTWRVDTGPSHLVNVHLDSTRTWCGVRGPFTTSGSPDFQPCKRCLRAWEKMLESRAKEDAVFRHLLAQHKKKTS